MPDDLTTLLTNPYTGPGNVQQAETMRKILHAALFAGAAGAGARTLQGVGNFLGRNFGSGPRVPLRQSTLPVPVPVVVGPPRRRKAAALAPPASAHADPLTWAAQHLSRAVGTLRSPGEQFGPLRQPVTGWGAGKLTDMPWAYPAAAAAVGGGLYGGYKLTDWLLDRTRKREVESELERARREYQEAMMGQYDHKAASPDPVDALYAGYAEKRAGLGKMLRSGLGSAAEAAFGAVPAPVVGLGLLGMGTVGLASGVGAYNWARSRSRTKALEEAVRRRQEALFAQAPRPIMAVPVPHAPGFAAMPGEEDEDGEDTAKLGSVAQAADSTLQQFARKKQQAAQQWQLLINGPPKGGRAARPQEPQPPRLPTLAGAYLGPAQPTPAA